MLSKHDKEIMINSYIIGVMHERTSNHLGVMVDGNYTDEPEEMAKYWLDTLLKELDRQTNFILNGA